MIDECIYLTCISHSKLSDTYILQDAAGDKHTFNSIKVKKIIKYSKYSNNKP